MNFPDPLTPSFDLLPTREGFSEWAMRKDSVETFFVMSEETEVTDHHHQHLPSPPQTQSSLVDIKNNQKDSLEKARWFSTRYQDEIREARHELELLHRLQREQRYRQKREERDILLQYMPDHPLQNYRQILGPMLENLVETSRQVGTYDIEACIGQGGFGQVFVVQDRCNDGSSASSSKNYALKKVEKKRLLSSKHLDRLSNELRVLCMADHPNLVNCHQVLNGRDHIYVAMNLARMDLFSYRNLYAQEFATMTGKSTRSGGATIQITRGLFRGLDYLHSKLGVAHLDIKLENLLVTENVPPHLLRADHIQICDFGMCAIASPSPSPSPLSSAHQPQHDSHRNDIVVVPDDPWTRTTKTFAPIQVVGTCGTYGFLAPEMLLFGVSEGRQADMWSTDVTLLQLVANSLPSGWEDAYHPSTRRDECSAILLECLEQVHTHPS